jgi:enterochelin esterase-like enzyme
MKKLLAPVIASAFVCTAFSQEPVRAPAVTAPGGAPVAGRGRGPALVSPEVHADRTVTLRILAPLAKSVTVSGEIMGTRPAAELTPDANGVWSVTLDPLEPEIYSYGFTVDGMTVNDQRTSYVKPSGSYTSQVEVPGDGPQFYDAMPVPHGDVRIVMYEAKTLDGRTRRMRVYTPPDYEMGSKKYPVLYLLHGGGDWDVAWTDVGRANLIMDNLIADGAAKPMIVVMPSIYQQEALGSGAMAAAGGRGAAGRGNTQTAGQDDAFTKELLGDIMPLIQKRYRILTGPDNTAIAGLSMGGAQTLRTGLAHLDTFHYLVALSAAGGGRGATSAAGAGGAAAPADPLAAYPALTADVAGANRKLKLLALYNGREDSIVRNGPKILSEAMLAKGVHVKYTETNGGHWFIVWRRNLRDFAPMLFR